jgi:hypothetical protein
LRFSLATWLWTGYDRPGTGMMTKKQAIVRMQAIRAILVTNWNPIGFGVPPDENDAYVAGIHRLLEARADAFKLTAHLGMLERISMGLTEQPENNRRVAEKLIELGKQFFE